MNDAKTTLNSAIVVAGLTVSAVFVPWSQSRFSTEKYPSLNWKITLTKNGRDILATDYMAGNAHCPVRKCSAFNAGAHAIAKAIMQECETGFQVTAYRDLPIYGSFPMSRLPILPDACDVIHSLVLDCNVLDYSGFEDWASNHGCETDSRKAVATYRACLEIALKIRAELGDATLRALRDAGMDY